MYKDLQDSINVPAGDFQALSEETETVKKSGPAGTAEPAPEKEKDLSSG